MRQETINIYKFSELSEKAQRRAWENGPDFSGDFSGDFRATLAAFEKIFDISVYRWNVNDYNYNFAYVTAGAATEAPENSPLRLARYIWNNYIDACLTAFFQAWQADIEYHASMEYFAEICEINDYEFTETGEFWK